MKISTAAPTCHIIRIHPLEIQERYSQSAVFQSSRGMAWHGHGASSVFCSLFCSLAKDVPVAAFRANGFICFVKSFYSKSKRKTKTSAPMFAEGGLLRA